MNAEQDIAFVTGSLSINYRKPVPIEHAVELRARVADFSARKAIVKCTVSSRGLACAEAEVIAVRMPSHNATG